MVWNIDARGPSVTIALLNKKIWSENSSFTFSSFRLMRLTRWFNFAIFHCCYSEFSVCLSDINKYFSLELTLKYGMNSRMQEITSNIKRVIQKTVKREYVIAWNLVDIILKLHICRLEGEENLHTWKKIFHSINQIVATCKI